MQLSDLVFVDRVHDMAVTAMHAISLVDQNAGVICQVTSPEHVGGALTAAERALFPGADAAWLDHIGHVLDRLPAIEWRQPGPGLAAGSIRPGRSLVNAVAAITKKT